MANYTKEQILHMAEEEDVEFIRLQFTDMFGYMKNVAVPVSQLKKAMDDQCVIDASYVPGFDMENENEVFLYPDLSTFTVLPWRPQQGKVARFICDLYQLDGTPYEDSSRMILKKVMNQAAQKGYEMQMNPECEFFLFHTDDNGMPTNVTHEKAGYMDTTPLDMGENARREMVLTLEAMGYSIEASRHELAPAQHKINFAYSDMLYAADEVMTFKVAVRTVARRNGLHATFMPKPIANTEGSGMHLSMRLMKDGKNAFYDPEDERGLSKEAYSFIAGLCAHIRQMSAICNPLVNSYKRLITGFEAPYDITWSCRQKNAMIRIPKMRGEQTTIKLRSPDASANPYLVMALCMAAGMDGIEKGMEPLPEVPLNVKKMSAAEKKRSGIETLPANLDEALSLMEKDEFMQDLLGENFMRLYLNSKRKEWQSYMEHVSEWELDHYLYQM